MDSAKDLSTEPGHPGRLRTLAFDLALAGWTAMFGLAIPVLWITSAPASTVRLVARVWARGFLVLLAAIVGIRHVERGREHEPCGPCLIIANHQSVWETVAALVLFPDLAIVAKRELRYIPVMGWFLEHSAMIIIDRADGAKALRTMTEAARKAVADGRSVLIFPEGSRMDVDTPLKFKRGIELVYRALAIPVLPVALNSGRYWSRNPNRKSPGTIVVTMLPIIAPGLTTKRFTQEVETAINAAKSVL